MRFGISISQFRWTPMLAGPEVLGLHAQNPELSDRIRRGDATGSSFFRVFCFCISTSKY
jgi:hypothetical protein